MKYLYIIIIIIALLPQPAYACSGLLDCAFGWSERTELRTESAEELARIEAQRDADIAIAEAQAAERVRQADAEVERVKQMQYQSEADRDIAIAEAQAQAEQYRAMIAGLTSERTADIKASADTQIVALQSQAQIAIAGITEAGSTERWRIGGGWAFSIVALFVLGVLLTAAMRRHREPVRVVRLAGTQYGRLPGDVQMIAMIRRGEVVRYEK